MVKGYDTLAWSRGMIHWHGLCWRFDKEPYNLMHQAFMDGKTDEECAKLLSDWAKLQYKMTANHPIGLDGNRKPKKNLWPPPEGTAPAPPDEKNPLIKLFMDVSESQENILEDHLLLRNRINLHSVVWTSLNQGKPLRDCPAIVKDRNGSLRLELEIERDHPNLVQHSQIHTQAWGANGDISLILSKSGPENPSVNESIAIEKYVSVYACKGNEPTGAVADLFNDMYNFICKSGKVPVISGGSLRATCPLTEDYCKTTLILHWHDCRKFSDIKDDIVSWNDLFIYFLLTGYCPNFVKADVERARNATQNGLMEDESDDDNSNFENMSQPDWIHVVMLYVI
ncbi:unnamed protein product [Mytilus coruscus]|uniref:Helitron helicase-like domain-containing protein n=1 Tax=Mytilus coruscus TaxID=42192 RepID=A0A6J8AQX6_MYTCO|nr:unnamed protein product [Mytilus coruscus]